MKKIISILILVFWAGCAKVPKKINPEYKSAMEKIPLILEEAKKFKIDKTNPDLWESIKFTAAETQRSCQNNSPDCLSLFQDLRKLVIEAIQIEEILENS